jgi:hypothetical protein
MGCEVYANGDEIACKAGDGKVIAAFPDVCLSPPSPPAGPIPVPYPNTSFSKDMQNGSKTVTIKGKEVMLKDQSFYKTAPLGDEAATRGLGAGVITHVITGKTYFVAWSMDVKFEGQNVDRHTDITTSNHASPMANASTPMPNVSTMEASEELLPPGDCNPMQYEKLKNAVDKSKEQVEAAGGACEVGDSPEVLKAKGQAWQNQADARSEREEKCFRGGNAGHKAAIASAREHARRCQYIRRTGKAPRWSFS